MIEFPQAFSLIDGTKRPAVKWSDPATCLPTSALRGRYGLPTGPRNGIFVVDLDRKNGVDGVASLANYAADHGEVPETRTTRTPSGGLHLYFLWDAARPVGNPVGILPGVDLRGDGGYVCAGGDYAVVNDVPIAVAPDWLVELARSRAEAAVVGESAVAITPDHPEWDARVAMATLFLINEPSCVSGQGGQKQLWKIALRIMRTYELPVPKALEILEGYNSRCVPPWTEAELARTLIRAAEEGQGPTGTFSSAFLPARVPAPIEGTAWRQARDPKHEYSIDLATACAGAMFKPVALGPKELTGIFAGPGAAPLWVGVWQYDSFRRRVVAVNPPFPLDAETAGISKRDLASVQVWAACTGGGKASIDCISNAIDVASRQAEFHPVRDYLDGLAKVDVKSAEAYFNGIAGRLWGATERDALESGHLRRLAIAAVRRIRRPGTKVDTMLVLAGEQGFRKSLLCSHLFGDFFLDQMPPVNSGRGHEASIAIEGRWGVEIAEMNALAHAHESAKKEFLTRCVDKYRPVFGVAVQEQPRQCVFIGTTNDDDFLTDPTGDTRYDICDVREPIKVEGLDRDAFWAAANALEAAGQPHWRDRAELARLGANKQESAAFTAEDVWTTRVLAYASGVAPDKQGERWITTHMVLNYGLTLAVEKQDERALNRVRGILRRAFGTSKVRRVDERSQRCYKVPVHKGTR